MNDPLFGNKLAAAVLVALLLFFGLPILAESLFGGHEDGHHGELSLAYPIAFDTEEAGAEDAEEQKIDLGTRLAGASAAGGERRAAICKSCHTLDKGGADGAGPNLWDLVGREVASRPGFGYTSALQSFGGVWTYERLDEYLKNSESYVPGTAMRQRFAKDEQRADLLAFLQTLSDGPVAFPASTAAAMDSEAGDAAPEPAAELMESDPAEGGDAVEVEVEVEVESETETAAVGPDGHPED